MNFAQEFTFLKETSDRRSKFSKFVGSETWFTFKYLKTDKDWLNEKPEQWTANDLFKKSQQFVANINYS